ncbi:Two-component response regulator, AmiR/NasT family, consists of REC and RNA-binding antiterminator (ANTAR) domains [Bosea sp. CRIB-10]|nr:Two-component response regulator, AmiR/NasT family, consists of REC and RNA-binding antiterminator (ANTAR) domains [Bosea sp. CRIB-10]
MAMTGYAYERAGGPHPTEPRATVSERPARQGAVEPELNIAVMVERDDHGEFLIRELQRQRATVRHVWPLPSQIPLQYDAIFCALSVDLPQRIPWVPGEPSSALILVDDGKAPLNLKLIHNCAAHGLLHYPATSRAIQSVLMLAREHFQYERRLRGRIEKLDENLRTMRVVERAKVLLIRLKNLTEDEAYGFLRKQAMEKRVTIAAVATAVIDSHDLLS